MVEERTQRHLAAILAAEVVGYTRLMEQDEADTFARLRAHRKELFEPEIEKHGGRVFKLTGDGLLAEFGSVVDAVECAVAVQRGMAERNKDVADDRRESGYSRRVSGRRQALGDEDAGIEGPD